MFKSIVFFSLLGLSLAAPTEMESASDYMGTIKELFEYSDATPACKKETDRMKECFKTIVEEFNQTSETTTLPSKEEVFKSLVEVREALRCTGEVTCSKSKLSKYLVETAVYAVEHMYGGGFECLNEHNLQMSMVGCMLMTIPREDLMNFSVDKISEHIKPIGRCVAKAQKCGKEAQLEFLKGTMAFAEITEVSLKLAHAVRSQDKSFAESFNKEFDSYEFDNVEL
ncbi:hypothetical protein CAEBREN_09889 [Caenorhabditis brenneri]|uniref:DUF19 domain-containing protein n=1 Tax=Caenorhabditis brenneri TaxID=135651 RepID=G0N6T5_CAEBE|nr:hypothetical protein CAEBREN_09889 [Caenorhabditis brenneri]